MKSTTYGVFVFLRAFLVDGKTDAGVKLMEQSRIYPLAQKDNPPAMKFPNASAKPADYDFKRDIRYFESLAEFINHEPVAPEDMAMRGMAASLGIVKGKPFQPDAKMKALFNKAADVGFKMAAATSYDSHNPDKLIYPDRKWEVVFPGGSPVFRQASYLDFDAMIFFFHKAYSTSAAMVLAMPGKGSQYLVAYCDADGDFTSGGQSYRLHMPAHVPAANYWSVVLYDADTRSLLDNGQPFPSIASNSNLKSNPDGSADIYFGPTPPKVAKSGDNEKLKTLIAESISEILRAGLTKNQLSTLEIIKNEHRELLNQLLSQAFQRGWTRSGSPNLSNAMDEVLRAAQEAIKEYRNTVT